MAKALKKVLLVDISEKWPQRWEKELGGKVELIHELTIEGALQSFAENKDLAIIVTIACMASDRPNTMNMVSKFRRNSRKIPIVAVSQFPNYRKKLKDAGCSHECPREGVVGKITELI